MDPNPDSDSNQLPSAVDIFDSLQRVRPLPEVWTPVDDWTGITSQVERKRRQNRLNQRAWRECDPATRLRGLGMIT
jgi:hypothetical protein